MLCCFLTFLDTCLAIFGMCLLRNHLLSFYIYALSRLLLFLNIQIAFGSASMHALLWPGCCRPTSITLGTKLPDGVRHLQFLLLACSGGFLWLAYVVLPQTQVWFLSQCPLSEADHVLVKVCLL